MGGSRWKESLMGNIGEITRTHEIQVPDRRPEPLAPPQPAETSPEKPAPAPLPR